MLTFAVGLLTVALIAVGSAVSIAASVAITKELWARAARRAIAAGAAFFAARFINVNCAWVMFSRWPFAHIRDRKVYERTRLPMRHHRYSLALSLSQVRLSSVDPLDTDTAAVYSYYMQLWKVFYCSYLMTPFAR